MEYVRDSPKVNVFCAVSSCKVYGPFFFAEPTVTGINYLDMLQLWLMPQLQHVQVVNPGNSWMLALGSARLLADLVLGRTPILPPAQYLPVSH
jgi:hypothetical protein